MKKVSKSKESMIVVQKDELYVGTWTLSQGFEIEHRSLTRLVKRYKNEFEELGLGAIRLRAISPKHGPSFEEFLLCEEQAIYLTTLLQNNYIVRKFKQKLSKDFVTQRKCIEKMIATLRVQKKNAEWLAQRVSGKIERRRETDAIKEFCEYATAQGSQNAKRYYANITQMQNNALFNLEFIKGKYGNLRDVLSGFELRSLEMADRLVEKGLRDGMAKKMYYKEIYLMVKARIETFAESLGKVIPTISNSEYIKIELGEDKYD